MIAAKPPVLVLAALVAPLTLVLSTATAQDTVVTYQGQLTEGGAPANGSYDLAFRLYDAPTDGSLQGIALGFTGWPVTNGLFTVPLDFGSGIFTGQASWLQIDVMPNGGSSWVELSPRQPLTASPYALYAPNAGTAGSAARVTGPVPAGQLTGTISPDNIGAGSVTTGMLAAGAVGSHQLAPGAVTTGALADGAVTAAKLATASDWIALTIPNPTPAAYDYFGRSVAAVGSDRLLIGAYGDHLGGDGVGAAYLLSAGGALLTSFTNPTPESGDSFGFSVAAAGTERVLIGAHHDNTGGFWAGTAYLFSTEGRLLTTFTNPMPAIGDEFGFSVAAVGTERVLIGARYDDMGADDAGTAYLFDTGGTLLTAFSNPTPAAGDRFGISVAAVGSDHVLIGADYDDTGASDAGAAYLFSANGALLTTFTNPTPAASACFGNSVAAMGNDRVLIGAWNAGEAYLFSTNGALLTTFTNPTLAVGDAFGGSLAAVGTDRVLIGASGNDTGASNAGAAYLFDTGATLLTAFSNPTPAIDYYFGNSVAAVGSGRVLIGGWGDDTGASDAGAACLFTSQLYTPGLVAEGVTAHSITTASLEDGAVTVAKLANGAVNEAILAPTIGVWARSGDDVFRLAGRVGIGTGHPQATLHVVGDALVQGTNFTAPGHTASLLVGDVNHTLRSIYDGGLRLGVWPDADALAIQDGTANVGIGTTTPATKLHVAGTVTAAGFSGSGAGLTSLNASQLTSGVLPSARVSTNITLLGGSIESSEITDGTITAADVQANVFWSSTGNSGTTPGTHFLGTTDDQPFEFRVGGQQAFRLERSASDGSVLMIGGGTNNQFNLRATGGVRVDTGSSPGISLNAADRALITCGWNPFTSGIHAGLGRWGMVMEPHTLALGMPAIGGKTVQVVKYNEDSSYTPLMSVDQAGTVTALGFNPTSDRDSKENIEPVDSREVLEKVAALPVSRWHFKEDAATPHVGPMAQDFHAAFGLGTDDRHIATVDADGVALAAIQGLNRKLEETRAENAALRKEVQEIRQILSSITKKGDQR